MAFTKTLIQRFEVVSCYSCGVPFGITDELYRRAVTDAIGGVYCPACGKSSCWRESEDQKKIRELNHKLQREQQRHDQTKADLRETESRRRAEKGANTRLKKRIAAGVCPCCNRSFQNLHRHMENQHPDFVKAEQQSSGEEA